MHVQAHHAGDVRTIDGRESSLGEFSGRVRLVVNVASKCGLTPQYEGLEALYRTYHDRGFEILAFPANEFGAQEPGTEAEIQDFCATKYDVTFPLFSKIVVKGEGIAPLYEYLTSPSTDPNHAGPITWNFEKFLIGRDGKVVGRYKSAVEPMSDELTKAIKKELDKSAK